MTRVSDRNFLSWCKNISNPLPHFLIHPTPPPKIPSLSAFLFSSTVVSVEAYYTWAKDLAKPQPPTREAVGWCWNPEMKCPTFVRKIVIDVYVWMNDNNEEETLRALLLNREGFQIMEWCISWMGPTEELISWGFSVFSSVSEEDDN